MNQTAAQWIKHLRLQPHPEGGWYRETYRAAEQIPARALPRRYNGARNFGTAIYFLLRGREFSAFHRLHSDEMWHFYHGAPFLVVDIAPDGTLTEHRLGLHPQCGELPQIVVPRGHWFAARITTRRGYTLLGCTVAPGFDFADFEMADRQELGAKFPHHKKLISELTK
jgi:hypothetical protein